MPDVLLVYPPYLSKYKNPPLGLGYIGSCLEHNGYTVKILDMDPIGYDFNDLEDYVRRGKPDIVGISFMTNQFSNAMRVSEIIKKICPEIPVIMGGNHASALPEELLKKESIDFVVIGEGEITMLELVHELGKSVPDFSKVCGIAYRQDGHIEYTPKRELIDDLDSLPFPLWRDFPPDEYSEMIIGTKEELPAFSILATRGCPNNCAFCSSHVIFTRRFRARSPQNVLDEMLFLNEEYGARHFNFVDDTFTISKSVISEFCDLLLENNLDFQWICNARVNTVTEGLLMKMRAAGCRNVCFGVESGDNRVRENISKNVKLNQIIDAHRWARKAGMVVISFFMVGNLGEDWDSIENTVKLAEELDTDVPTCSIATPFPGTRMRAIAEKNGWIKVRNWDRYLTSPHLMQDYMPVSVNGAMSQQELLDAYYYVNARFARKKLRSKYGQHYYANPVFYRKEIGKRFQERGAGEMLKLSYKMIRALAK